MSSVQESQSLNRKENTKVLLKSYPHLPKIFQTRQMLPTQYFLMQCYLTLCKNIRLDISIVVLAGPHKGSRRLEHLSDHVINKPVLIPDLQLVKLRLVVPVRSTKSYFKLFNPLAPHWSEKKKIHFSTRFYSSSYKKQKGWFLKTFQMCVYVYKKQKHQSNTRVHSLFKDILEDVFKSAIVGFKNGVLCAHV